MIHLSPRFVMLALICVPLMAGCGKSNGPPPTAKAVGKVTFKGKAVSDAEIYFVAADKGYSANAALGTDGSYEISRGLPAAMYKVYFAGSKIVKPPKPGQPQKAANAFPLPNKYLRETTSGQTAEVKAGDNKIDFTLQ